MSDEILVESLDISYVTDYVVLIFTKKNDNQFLEKNFGENLTSMVLFLNLYIIKNVLN